MCGTDEELRERLSSRGLGTAVGWTDRMPAYLSAADVVVENAGGLTAFECFARGIPIVSYRPIPGHGRDNVGMMVRAGVTVSPADDEGLLKAVTMLSADSVERREQVERAAAIFVGDAAPLIVRVAQGEAATTVATH
jgi:UDP-N-acetylglucosamine:LPS N-acetylglucosamine transferase